MRFTEGQTVLDTRTNEQGRVQRLIVNKDGSASYTVWFEWQRERRQVVEWKLMPVWSAVPRFKSADSPVAVALVQGVGKL